MCKPANTLFPGLLISPERPPELATAVPSRVFPENCAPSPEPAQSKSSRRRRLWELADRAHCPLVGVCLPVDTLRRLMAKVLDGTETASDYDLHCRAVTDCARRTPVSEALQRELDRRFAQPLRQSAACKQGDALRDWWRDAVAGGDAGAALWVTLTHARCDAALEDEVLRTIHMLQHRAGAEVRDALQRLAHLESRNVELAGELDDLRRRNAAHDLEQGRQLEQAHASVLQLRAQLVGRDARIDALGERIRDLEAEVSTHGGSRAELQQENRRLEAKVGDLQRRLQQAEQALLQPRQNADRLPPPRPPATLPEPAEPPAVPAPLPRLGDCAVLCVGGRPASVPVYRALIESTGGRFLHHDGGDENSTAKLDGTLAAADVVICQTGCMSHESYQRVKAYCKRTGKRCLFVENPSASSLRRALEGVAA